MDVLCSYCSRLPSLTLPSQSTKTSWSVGEVSATVALCVAGWRYLSAAEMAELAEACVLGGGRRLNMVVAGLITKLPNQTGMFRPFTERQIDRGRDAWVRTV